MPALTRVRLVLEEVRLETRRTAAENEAMAARYAERGDQAAARMEWAAAAARRQRLADLDTAFEALEQALSATVQSESWGSQPYASPIG